MRIGKNLLGSVGQPPGIQRCLRQFAGLGDPAVYRHLFCATLEFALFPRAVRHPQAEGLNFKSKSRSPGRVGLFPAAQLATCVSYWRYQRFLVLDYSTREALSLSALSYPLAVCGLVWISPHYSHASHGVGQLGLSGPPVVLEGG